MENEFFNEELKYELLNYINENSFNKLISNTVLKLETNLVNFTIKIHSFYNKSDPINKRILREFWDCFPYYFWDRYFLQNSYWKILFEQYIQDFGFKNLRKNTIYKNKNIGSKLYKLRKKYVKSTFKQQKKITNLWSCIPLYFWNERNDKFKKLFTNNSFEELSYNIYKNSNSKLGLKACKIHIKYIKSPYFRKMELKKYWDCFPDDFFGNRYLKNIEWKILFRDFFKENALDYLNRSTTYKNKNIGIKAYLLIKRYYSSATYEKIQIKKYWDCFPDDFWTNKTLYTSSYWKILFEQYIQEFGFKNLRNNTIYRNKNIGSKLYKLRKRYTKSTFKQQQKMRDFWDCIPLYFWNERNDKFKKLFIIFIKNNGFEKLSYNNYKNSNSKLSLKAYKIHMEYKNSHFYKKIELKKYWDCFPKNFWINKRGINKSEKSFFTIENKKVFQEYYLKNIYKKEKIYTSETFTNSSS